MQDTSALFILKINSNIHLEVCSDDNAKVPLKCRVMKGLPSQKWKCAKQNTIWFHYIINRQLKKWIAEPRYRDVYADIIRDRFN